jgi:hypothetical protein
MAPPSQVKEKEMDSAFGIDHGEVSKGFGLPKNTGTRSLPFGHSTKNKAKKVGSFVNRNTDRGDAAILGSIGGVAFANRYGKKKSGG